MISGSWTACCTRYHLSIEHQWWHVCALSANFHSQFVTILQKTARGWWKWGIDGRTLHNRLLCSKSHAHHVCFMACILTNVGKSETDPSISHFEKKFKVKLWQPFFLGPFRKLIVAERLYSGTTSILSAIVDGLIGFSHNWWALHYTWCHMMLKRWLM